MNKTLWLIYIAGHELWSLPEISVPEMGTETIGDLDSYWNSSPESVQYVLHSTMQLFGLESESTSVPESVSGSVFKPFEGFLTQGIAKSLLK